MHIALHDGFAGQTVAVAIDGHEVYRRTNLHTDLRISRADAFDTAVTQRVVNLSVSVEPGGLKLTLPVDTVATPYVAVDVVDGVLRLRPSDEPFHYL